MSGIILHPTALPGRFGIGDLGPEARRFVELLAAADQHLWQVLPLNPIYAPWFSPYSSVSAFAGNPLVISPEVLREQGLLDLADLEAASRSPGDRVDFGQVVAAREQLLARASQSFRRRASPALRQRFEQFEYEARAWLEDYALFMAILQQHGRYWRQWDERLRYREPHALEEARRQLAEEVFHQKYLQFEFHRQWDELKQHANARGIRLIGDMPLYVSLSSADVWAHPEYFQLAGDRVSPTVVAGAPPDDVFSFEGQRWGSPIYDWPRLARDDYRWWADRLRKNIKSFDYIRLDHFPGFETYWAIPADSPTPKEGHWQQGPGAAFFTSLQRQLGELPVVAEDLGIVTPAMRALRDQLNFPGMFVLQYAFKPGQERPYDCRRDCVLYTGTHDSDTTAGWFHSLSESERRGVLEYLGHPEPGEIHRELIRLAWSSVARWALAPLQDVMGLGAEARINRPGLTDPRNWSWRFRWEQLPEEALTWLTSLTRTYGRVPAAAPPC